MRFDGARMTTMRSRRARKILLVPKTSIHAQQDIETPPGTPKQFTVRRPRPACGLHGADLVSRQLGGESTWQILVKQNAHGPKRNPEPDRVRQPPVASRPTGTDRGTGRGSLPLPDSRTSPEPAPACRGRPAHPPRSPGRCGRPRAHRPCDHHTSSIRSWRTPGLARLRWSGSANEKIAFPAAIATYCFPSTAYPIGPAWTRPPTERSAAPRPPPRFRRQRPAPAPHGGLAVSGSGADRSGAGCRRLRPVHAG